MYDNYNYPMGADTPDAPWNRSEPEEEEVEVTATTTMRREATVHSTDVIYEKWSECERDEDGSLVTFGGTDRDTSNCDFEKDYKAEHMTIGELLAAFKDMLTDRLKIEKDTLELLKLGRYLSEAEAWEEVELEVEEA